MEKILRETFTRFNSESKQNIDVDSLVTSAMNMMPEFDETFINENMNEILEKKNQYILVVILQFQMK